MHYPAIIDQIDATIKFIVINSDKMHARYASSTEWM